MANFHTINVNATLCLQALGLLSNDCCHARIGPLLVTNPSFEASDIPGSVTGWTVTGAATSTPVSMLLPDAAGLVAPVSGFRGLLLGPVGVIRQVLGSRLGSAPFLQLRVAIGWPVGSLTLPTVVFELRSDSSNILIATVSVAESDFSLGPGAVDEVVLTANVSAIDAVHGEPLVVVVAGFGEDTVMIDNIRIDAFR